MKEARHHRGPPGSLSLDTQAVRGRAGLGDHQIYFIEVCLENFMELTMNLIDLKIFEVVMQKEIQ